MSQTKNMELDFENLGPKPFDEYEAVFSSLLKKTFTHLKVKNNYIIDVTIVDNKQIHSLNREYRNVDRPTDVISFAFLDDKEERIMDQEDYPRSLGQIVISYEKAISQAKEYGHTITREMSFLFVHGLLHLLGYDHTKKEDEEVMFKIQDEILGGRVNG